MASEQLQVRHEVERATISLLKRAEHKPIHTAGEL
jgi:hypothetical protein